MKKHLNSYGILILLALVFIVVGCSQKANDSASPIAPEATPSATIECTGPSVDPVVYPDWQSGDAKFECGQVECCDADYHYKFDNWAGTNTSTTHEGNTITITNADMYTFSWTSEYPVSCVIVKAGTGANVYCYGGAYSDNGLVGYTGKEISHATFCFDEPTGYPLTVSKTAETSFTRTHLWTIDKTGEQTQLTLCEGDAATVNYNVTVNSTEYVDSDWKVTGTITIANIAPEGMTAVDAVINSISDIAGGVAATVDCELPLTVPAGETVTCTYTVDLPSGTNGTNTVTVTTSSAGVTGATATADYIFGEPTLVQDECITVSDDKYGDLGEVCLTAVPKTFSYSLEIEYEEYGLYEFTNTASFVTNDTETTGSDSWTVYVRVCQCETAWGGDTAGDGKAWWFYYETSVGGAQTIWAGQNDDAGTVEVVNGNIVITLTDGWELIDDDEAVKIQGYDVIPTRRPAAGKFTTYKGTELIVPVGDYPFYAIHLDVRKCPVW